MFHVQPNAKGFRKLPTPSSPLSLSLHKVWLFPKCCLPCNAVLHPCRASVSQNKTRYQQVSPFCVWFMKEGGHGTRRASLPSWTYVITTFKYDIDPIFQLAKLLSPPTQHPSLFVER